MAELPDAKKWFTGFIDITRWLKDIGTLIRLVAILVIAYILLVGGIALWKKWIPKPKPPKPPITINDIYGDSKVEQGDKTSKFGIITF